jgi:hypothetical protein
VLIGGHADSRFLREPGLPFRRPGLMTLWGHGSFPRGAASRRTSPKGNRSQRRRATRRGGPIPWVLGISGHGRRVRHRGFEGLQGILCHERLVRSTRPKWYNNATPGAIAVHYLLPGRWVARATPAGTCRRRDEMVLMLVLFLLAGWGVDALGFALALYEGFHSVRRYG